MSVVTLFITFALFVALGLGIATFITNTSRKTNQAFLVASSCMSLWLLSNLFILHTHSSNLALIGMNFAFAISACIPTTFHFLRLSITSPDLSWPAILNKCKPHIAINALVSASSFFPGFVKSVSFPAVSEGIGLATPEYGLPYIIFNTYFLSAIAFYSFRLYKDRRVLAGSQRVELEFLGFACIAGLIVGLSCGTIFALLIKTTVPVPIAHAISVLTLVTIVAYGISVHKILAVAVILRTITAYSLLSCYLTIVYLISWFFLSFASKELSIETTLPAHIIATLIIVFSMSSVRGRMQNVANKLVATQSMDISKTMKRAGNIFQSVTTINALMVQFSSLLKTSLSTANLIILTSRDSTLKQAYPATRNGSSREQLQTDSPLKRLVTKTREPVCRDGLERRRQTEENKATLGELEQFNMSIAIGFFSKSNLKGIVMLGSRTGDRIYDKNEQDALQILCNQFAVALENAYLYTEMQDSKIRNEIMLDQLASGVVVADPERKITLINNEAERITGLTEEQALGQDLGVLPDPISKALETTLATKLGRQDTTALLPVHDGKKGTHVRMGSAYLLSHDDMPMGALLVFTDMTELKQLEEQVRRTDQLSSVGTLAAGMAHEIKNPLVTIKTFTHLLPERHDDPEFREEFSSLVAHEVSRIDGIVNQLLSFSKPAHPHLLPMKLHDTVEQTLRLIREQLSQKNIVLNNNLRAKHDLISGDADLLTQTLVNINLNAIEAIESNGTISISTTNCTHRFAQGDNPDNAVSKACIRLKVRDTGKGIEENLLQKIFDPFFTGKSEGTGMGLSVVHGIIQEHHGVIEVASKPGKGTSFNIYIPILKEDVAT